ncbi:MAG: hypothetical protein D6691_10340 [Candidatus Hydrogenedentota bacterium]|nr:MAG: hypothetical protein D6691_10340 [Candidatus Hydrogenedentota bacterium]
MRATADYVPADRARAMKRFPHLAWILAFTMWLSAFAPCHYAASVHEGEKSVQQEIAARLLAVLVSGTTLTPADETKTSAPFPASRGQAEYLLETAALAMLPEVATKVNARGTIESRVRQAASFGAPPPPHKTTETSTGQSLVRSGCLKIPQEVATLLLLRVLQRSQHTDVGKQLIPAATHAIRKAEDRLATSDLVVMESKSEWAELVENALWYVALFESVGSLRQLGRSEEARRALKLAERLHAAIERNFWVSESRHYASVVVTTPSLQAIGRSPDLRPQLVAIALLPSNSSLRGLFSEIWEAHADLPSSATTPRQLELLAWFAVAAHAAGESSAWEEILVRIAASPIEEAVRQCPALAWLIARACFPT